ncbi:histone-like nucleoid-structuring protein, MvaT/MvaU family [Halomonas sp. AOP1-B1-8]|uniref:histone-like nucleoid-structuring protein, MvaT/MvaU family n=1 Tax=Halomonas sp. AOP1-B1-8 TaxID=3457726 RepID=UPI003FD9FD63
MSIYQEYTAKQRQLADIQQQMAKLEQDPAYQREREFLGRLTGLMQEFDKTPKALLTVLDKNIAQQEAKAPRRTAPTKYRNPNTGDVIEAKTKANRQYKAWCAEYGQDVVDTWKVD